MSPEVADLKAQIDTLRAEIAALENVRNVKAATLTTEEFAAMGAELDDKRKQLAKLTKAAAKALKLKKPRL